MSILTSILAAFGVGLASREPPYNYSPCVAVSIVFLSAPNTSLCVGHVPRYTGLSLYISPWGQRKGGDPGNEAMLLCTVEHAL